MSFPRKRESRSLAPPVKPGDDKGFLWLFAFLFALLLIPGFNSFEAPPIESVEAFVQHGRFGWETGSDTGIFYRGVDGLIYPIHEFGSILFSLPFAKLAYLISENSSFAFRDLFFFMMSFVSAAFFATTFLALALTFGDDKKRTATIFLLLISSQYLVYGLYPSDASICTLLLTLTFLFWRRAESGKIQFWLWTGFATGLMILTKYTQAVFLPVLGLLGLTTPGIKMASRVKHLLIFGLGLAPGLLLSAWWNELRTGEMLGWAYNEYHLLNFKYFPEGFLGTFFSPGKSIFFYTPTLLLLPFVFSRGGYFRTNKRAAFFVLGSFLIALFRITATYGWSSGGGWGNRYWVPWIPLLMGAVAKTGTGPRMRSGPVPVLIFLGLLINFSGALTNFHFRQIIYGYYPWQWDGANVHSISALPGNILRTLGVPIQEVFTPVMSERTNFVSNRLAVWWYGIQTAGVPVWISWGIGLSLFFLTLYLGFVSLSFPRKRESTDLSLNNG